MLDRPDPDVRSAEIICPQCGTRNRTAVDVNRKAPIIWYNLCRNLQCGQFIRMELVDVPTMKIDIRIADGK